MVERKTVLRHIRAAEIAIDKGQYGRARRRFRLAGYSTEDVITFYSAEIAARVMGHHENENLIADAVVVSLTGGEVTRRKPLPLLSVEQLQAIAVAVNRGDSTVMISGKALELWRAERVWTKSRGWANPEWAGPHE